MLPNPSQVAVEQVALVWRQKVAEIAADAVQRLIAERLSGSGIDGQDDPGEIVGADQPKAVFDEVAVAAFAVAERVVHMPPGSGHAFERRRRHPARRVQSWWQAFRQESSLTMTTIDAGIIIDLLAVDRCEEGVWFRL